MAEHATTAPPGRLTPVELAAWRGFLRAHAALVRELDAELSAEVGLPLTSYDVLRTLENAPGGRMRMSELADTVLLSRSGITRLVDRLVSDGLIERLSCPTDRRGFHAVITNAGRARLEAAAPIHLAGVRSRFLDHFDEPELAELAAIWNRLFPDAGE